MGYAASTTVTPERSRAELEGILRRYGATAFGYATTPLMAGVQFEAHGRRVRLTIPLPNRTDKRFTQDPRYSYKARTPAAAQNAYEQACRQIWRALVLVVKAKLEAVDAGVASFEDEFLAYVLLPNGATVGDEVRAHIEHAYATGNMPALMPGVS